MEASCGRTSRGSPTRSRARSAAGARPRRGRGAANGFFAPDDAAIAGATREAVSRLPARRRAGAFKYADERLVARRSTRRRPRCPRATSSACSTLFEEDEPTPTSSARCRAADRGHALREAEIGAWLGVRLEGARRRGGAPCARGAALVAAARRRRPGAGEVVTAEVVTAEVVAEVVAAPEAAAAADRGPGNGARGCDGGGRDAGGGNESGRSRRRPRHRRRRTARHQTRSAWCLARMASA